MTVDDFKVFLTRMEEQEHIIMYTKGTEYTLGSDDKLANFKQVAKDTGSDALLVWSIYFAKHIASIMNYVKDRKVHSEPIRGRFQDARNYLALGIALIEETEHKIQEDAFSYYGSSTPVTIDKLSLAERLKKQKKEADEIEKAIKEAKDLPF